MQNTEPPSSNSWQREAQTLAIRADTNTNAGLFPFQKASSDLNLDIFSGTQIQNLRTKLLLMTAPRPLSEFPETTLVLNKQNKPLLLSLGWAANLDPDTQTIIWARSEKWYKLKASSSREMLSASFPIIKSWINYGLIFCLWWTQYGEEKHQLEAQLWSFPQSQTQGFFSRVQVEDVDRFYHQKSEPEFNLILIVPICPHFRIFLWTWHHLGDIFGRHKLLSTMMLLIRDFCCGHFARNRQIYELSEFELVELLACVDRDSFEARKNAWIINQICFHRFRIGWTSRCQSIVPCVRHSFPREISRARCFECKYEA